MRFAMPWVLLLAPLVITGAWWWGRQRFRAAPRILLPDADDRLTWGGSPWVAIDRAMPWLRALTLLLFVVALARPQSGARIETVSSFGVDIVLAVDVSGSMQAEDFQPDNRLAVAKATVSRFVTARREDRLGLISFASQSATRCPLTLDHQMLQQFVDDLRIAPEEQQQTAIGLGLASAVNRLRDSEAISRVVILLTDGRNNAGEVGPRVATAAAAALGVKVYTVGVGSDGPAPFPVGVDLRGQKRYQMVQFELDEPLLEEIAAETGGRYFRATDSDTLARIFEEIDELETTKRETRQRVVYSEQFSLALLPALALLLFERLLLATRLRRIP